MSAWPAVLSCARRVRRRGRTLRSVFRSWDDVRLGLRVATWALAVPGLRRVLPLPLLARWLWRPAKTVAVADLEGKTTMLIRWLLPATRSSCLTRSLVLYRVLSAHRRDVELVLAMRRLADGWTGHAWIVLEGRPFAEAAAGLDEFTPVVVFGPRGAPRESAGARPDAIGR